MLNNTFSEQSFGAIKRLIEAISPSKDLAEEHLTNLLKSDPEDVDADGPDALLWLLKDVVDWETGYFVDWKDTESFVQCLTDIASAWGASLGFGVDDPLDEDFLDEVSVPDLMVRAHSELLEQGLVLWNWDTGGDCYSGWITRIDSRPTMNSISATLETEIREGSQPF